MSAKNHPPEEELTAVPEDQAEDQGVAPGESNEVPVDAAEDVPVSAADEETEEAEEAADEEEGEEEGKESLEAQLEKAESRATEYLDGLQRERAAFQNYKRRVERERIEQQQAISGRILLKLLPTLDDFHRAMEAIPDDKRDEWFEGVTLIQRKLENVLKDEGVREIDALGQPFDPNYHEAVGVDGESEAESGTVTQVLQRGYMLKDQVLRPAMVRVAE